MYSVLEDEQTLTLATDASHSTSSAFYSSNCTKQDALFIGKFLIANKITTSNTRIVKLSNTEYQVKIAASLDSFQKAFVFENVTVHVSTGDYAKRFQNIMDNLKKAQQYCANETEKKMLQKYIEHFQYGCVADHEYFTK